MMTEILVVKSIKSTDNNTDTDTNKINNGSYYDTFSLSECFIIICCCFCEELK